MTYTAPTIVLVAILGALILVRLVRLLFKRRFPLDTYLGYSGWFFLCFVLADRGYFIISVWLLALISFRAIREYFSLIDIRLQDRPAIFGAYLLVPFMYYFIQIEWYGMFIVSIPVYGFLAIPLLVALGGRETAGTVLSIGAVNFGLFLFVFCIGHIAYLLSYSSWMAALLILNVLICDAAIAFVRRHGWSFWKRTAASALLPALFTVPLSLVLSGWTEIPPLHSAILGLLTPLLVVMGHQAGSYVEADLGIEEDLLVPGRGQILDNLQSLFYAAPVMFHYIRYFIK